MITLSSDCLLFQLANGESVPFSSFTRDSTLSEQMIWLQGDVDPFLRLGPERACPPRSWSLG